MTENANRKPNHLINELSPYLLQHAYNPVDWYPWCDEAFERAEKEDKLVFLSIGYATCHWCHVMERESFEDEITAKILNRHFISIKVDREERPDIDAIYMDAIHIMGQQGGWPLNLFLTPNKHPIAGGTYYPPKRRYQMLSFNEVLVKINELWENERDKVAEASRKMEQYIRNTEAKKSSEGLPSTDCFRKAYVEYLSNYDRSDYGFISGSNNKFPPSMAISFLLQYCKQENLPEAREIAERTLSAMKRGGIYDQIGGGICRYSTDKKWLVPHFEKMLYDNSLFIKALAECFQITKNDFYKDAAYDIIKYITRDMTLPDGGIASAEDADSEGEEGKFYTWSWDDFSEVTGDDRELMADLWNVTKAGNFEGKNILNEDIHKDILSFAKAYNKETLETIERNREKLLHIRSARIRPLRDDKALTSWNCLYIQALASAGMIFNDKSLINQSASLFDFISMKMIDKNERLMRRYRNGKSGVNGYLSDYAEMALAACILFRATSELRYIKSAIYLADESIRLFASDFGAFYETGSDAEELIRRSINGYDSVEPSGNSSIAHVLLFLANMGINTEKYSGIAERLFAYFGSEIEKYPTGYPMMLKAYMYYNKPSTQIILIGKNDNPDMIESLKMLNADYSFDTLAIAVDPDDLPEMSSLLPIVAGKEPISDFTAYVCANASCLPPATSYKQLAKLLLYNISDEN